MASLNAIENVSNAFDKTVEQTIKEPVSSLTVTSEEKTDE
jgi:hypothetical protein